MSRHRIPFRRRQERRTDYRKRLELLKSGQPRLVVRRSVNNVVVSIIGYEPSGDSVTTAFHSKDLAKQGWKHSTGNIPAAYLAGYVAAKRAMAKGVTSAVLDIGTQAPIKGGRVFAALKGAIDAGLEVPHSDAAFPADDRIKGEHIKAHLGVDLAADIEKIKSS